MKTIAEAISDLLYVRDTVVVPGLGAFVKKPTSAQVNRVANYFTAPSCVVGFDNDLREDNDLIVNYIAGENEISDDEARRLLAMFVSDSFSKLKKGEKVALSGIGTLRYDWHSDIVLEQDASSNFNSDAFGLSDFTAVSVARSKTKDEIKAEIEQQQKEKNTPVTVDEKAIHNGDNYDDCDYDYEVYDDFRPRRPVWPWILLAILLLACAVFALQHFRIYNFKRWFIPKAPINRIIDTVNEPEKTIETDTIEFNDTICGIESDTLQNVVEQPVEEFELNQEVDSIEEVVEGKILIVAGCFSNEENAFKLVDKLKEQGYQSALAEKHGEKWFVAYGRYRTEEEALVALKKIKADSDAKAWIRK